MLIKEFYNILSTPLPNIIHSLKNRICLEMLKIPVVKTTYKNISKRLYENVKPISLVSIIFKHFEATFFKADRISLK